MPSWHENAFRIAGPLWGESTGDQWCEVLMFHLMPTWKTCLNNQSICRWFEIPSWDITIMRYTCAFCLSKRLRSFYIWSATCLHFLYNQSSSWWFETLRVTSLWWKHFPRYWPLVRGIHLSPVDFPHEGQWRGALMFSLICAWTNGGANNRNAGDLRHHRVCYDATVMINDAVVFFTHTLVVKGQVTFYPKFFLFGKTCDMTTHLR